MKKFQLVLAVLCYTLASAGEFDYAAYRPSSLTEAVASAYAMPDTDYHFEAANLKNRVQIAFTGEHRATIPEVQDFIGKWVDALGHPTEYKRLFVYETEVQDTGGAKYWLPLQNTLVEPFGTEVKTGGQVTLYVMYVGALRLNKVFIVNEFSTGNSQTSE